MSLSSGGGGGGVSGCRLRDSVGGFSSSSSRCGDEFESEMKKKDLISLFGRILSYILIRLNLNNVKKYITIVIVWLRQIISCTVLKSV